MKADKFIDLVKRHTELAEFTPLLLNEFIEKVVVYEPVKENGKRNQRVDIYLNFIGQFTHPITEDIMYTLVKTRNQKYLDKSPFAF